MNKQSIVNSSQSIGGLMRSRRIHTISCRLSTTNVSSGFTLIETLVAILLITIAIVAPMGLTVQSLSSAEYARDEITASNLAQEGIEVVRSIRDSNILNSAEGGSANLFDGIIIDGSNFKVDGTITSTNPTLILSSCNGSCPPLQTNGQLYSYNSNDDGGYVASTFTRTMTATKVRTDSVSGSVEEIRVTSQVSWKTAAFKTRSVSVSEDLYNWPQKGSGA